MLVEELRHLAADIDPVDPAMVYVGNEDVCPGRLQGDAVGAPRGVGRFMGIAGAGEAAEGPMRAIGQHETKAVGLVGYDQPAIGEHDAVLRAQERAIGWKDHLG